MFTFDWLPLYAKITKPREMHMLFNVFQEMVYNWDLKRDKITFAIN